jgi:osmotically-inducible protein OsmY
MKNNTRFNRNNKERINSSLTSGQSRRTGYGSDAMKEDYGRVDRDMRRGSDERRFAEEWQDRSSVGSHITPDFEDFGYDDYADNTFASPAVSNGSRNFSRSKLNSISDQRSSQRVWDIHTGGGFAGKGPKGYQRSDERIREDVCEMLARHPEVDASEIEVSVSDGAVTMTGTVEDISTKRLAANICHESYGVKDVHNQLRINPQNFAEKLNEKSEESKNTRTSSKKS